MISLSGNLEQHACFRDIIQEILVIFLLKRLSYPKGPFSLVVMYIYTQKTKQVLTIYVHIYSCINFNIYTLLKNFISVEIYDIFFNSLL